MTTPLKKSDPAIDRCLRLELSSDPAEVGVARKAAEKFAREIQIDESDVHSIGLCVNEALSNVIRHAYAGETDRPIELDMAMSEDEVEVRIRDWGNGVVPPQRRASDRDPTVPGGLGVICLRELMDEIVYEPQSPGMLLIMKRRCSNRKDLGR